jgi:hypothetical protein
MSLSTPTGFAADYSDEIEAHRETEKRIHADAQEEITDIQAVR